MMETWGEGGETQYSFSIHGLNSSDSSLVCVRPSLIGATIDHPRGNAHRLKG